ncbi:hypothetical protein HPY86_01260 [candidate division WOR-3 bacterium]|nr:hypothetical protein [candidate division WOR-3 bacterium]
MGAGVAFADWRNSFGINPSTVLSGSKFAIGVTYVNLYALPGVHCGLIGAKWKSGKQATAVAFTSVGFDGYRENDLLLNFATEPVRTIRVGVGVHALMQTVEGKMSLLPQVDAGVLWLTEHTAIGVSGRRLNAPRLPDGTVLKSQLWLGGLWKPIKELKLACDFKKEDQLERLLIGGEFTILPEVTLRCGVETFPLVYHGGVQVKVGVMSLDYGVQYHLELGDSHSITISAEWH